MGKLFGTDGIRGIVGENLTAELAYRVGQAVTMVLMEEKGRRPLITIGMDTRISSDMLEGALISGITSVGGDVMALGVTFRYSENGLPQGLCKAKRLFYVSTAGGPVLPSHMGFDYVDALAKNYFSIPNTALFSAENLDVIGADPQAILARAKEEIDRDWRERA